MIYQPMISTDPPTETPAASSPDSPTAGLILGGGFGRRFGGPKAFATLPDGRTFLTACAQAMTAAGLGPIAATIPPGADDLRIPGLRIVPLPSADLDMFGSIRIGLGDLIAAADWRGVVILPVDHPLVNSGTVAALAGTDHAAVIPTLAGRHGHPIRLGREVAEGVADGRCPGPTLREVMRAAGSVDLAVDDAGIRANCNTREAMLAAWDDLCR